MQYDVIEQMQNDMLLSRIYFNTFGVSDRV